MTAARVPLNRLPALEALRHRDFRFIWFASWSWYGAQRMELMLILPLLVLKTTDSPFWVGMVGFLRFIPLGLGAFIGILADRVNRKRLLIGIHSMHLFSMALLAAVVLTGIVNLWYIAVVSFIMGFGFAADLITRRTLVRDLVGPKRITAAFSLDVTALMGSFILGPLLGGLILSLVQIGGAYLALAALYALGLGFLFLARSVSPPERSARRSVLRDLREGVQYAARKRIIWSALLAVLVANLLIFSWQPMIPVIAQDELHLGPGLTGLVASSIGIGALVGALGVASIRNLRHHGRFFLGGIALLGVSGVGLALSSHYSLAVAVLIIGGVGAGIFASMEFPLFLIHTSREMAGRVIGIVGLVIGAMPLGMLLVGTLASFLGVRLAVAATSGTGALLALLLLATVSVLRQPSQPVDLTGGMLPPPAREHAPGSSPS